MREKTIVLGLKWNLFVGRRAGGGRVGEDEVSVLWDPDFSRLDRWPVSLKSFYPYTPSSQTTFI